MIHKNNHYINFILTSEQMFDIIRAMKQVMKSERQVFEVAI